MAFEARPAAAPDANRGVEFAGRKIDQPVVGAEPDREIGVANLELAEPRRQPGGRQRLRGADRQQGLILGDEPRKASSSVSKALATSGAIRRPASVSDTRPLTRANRDVPSRSSNKRI